MGKLGETPVFPKSDCSVMSLPLGPPLGGMISPQLFSAASSFRQMIGFPDGSVEGPLLWHIDSPSGDGRVTDCLCKMLVDSEEASWADTMWVVVHLNTKDVSESELALGRLASADIVLQWPRPDLSSALAPPLQTGTTLGSAFPRSERLRTPMGPISGGIGSLGDGVPE